VPSGPAYSARMTDTPGAGWYRDPTEPGRLRYWDGARWTEQTQTPPEAATGTPPDAAVGAPLARYSGPAVLVVTTNDAPGYDVVEVYGEIFGMVVRARNAFSNAGASFRTVFGGEAKGYTQLLSDSRVEAVERLRANASALGANGVLAMRFESGEIANLMNEVIAYGTAVKLQRRS
jgi:uncharacterized protein YbjQ (UPF0145 family)